ncbi:MULTISPECIES: hypothetical protein [unclassified Enterococcus]|uniref:hypothetical protein n=1 Tax=unclassified Enterococcus TaxID=2608891 RepID=UPI001552340A|nr:MULTISPECIES: hypothetical protein [unclassified Enterococcus]MBS7577973.1 hypothetical protein [Enterococcus sp. MMGLQ5-2]MBS7585166.1 hypothetical protein [Enterococcus sp. MMGLQ5-1]NPD13023.1 hypothetical protein [Enterococcus sp. MMGLQ5-1]NPD37803.1 hypothetical protein [Enterococcus sp. MMGLQ5-2]
MVHDINAEKRFEIAQEIQQIEQNEETLHHLKQNFQRSLEQFQNDFKQLANEDEALSYDSLKNGNPLAQADIQNSQTINHQLNVYVETFQEAIEASNRQMTQNMNEQIDLLHQERNKLPWA